MSTKIDFAQLLLRRRFTVSQWLESEQISTLKQFDVWLKGHEHEFTFSEEFLARAKAKLNAQVLKDMQEASKVTAQLKEQELRNGFVELPAEKPESKKNKRQEPVNNPPKEE